MTHFNRTIKSSWSNGFNLPWGTCFPQGIKDTNHCMKRSFCKLFQNPTRFRHPNLVYLSPFLLFPTSHTLYKFTNEKHHFRSNSCAHLEWNQVVWTCKRNVEVILTSAHTYWVPYWVKGMNVDWLLECIERLSQDWTKLEEYWKGWRGKVHAVVWWEGCDGVEVARK